MNFFAKKRVAIANETQADLLISIHCDAFDNPQARGSSTFVMGMHKSEESLRVAMKENASIYQEDDYETRYAGFNPDDPDTYIALALKQSVYLNQSLELGSLIQNQFADRVGRKDRGVKQAGYYVISFTNMPSVLVELGFLTNPEEEDFLNSENGKELMASALLRAFRTYKEKHHPGPPAREPTPAPEPEPQPAPEHSSEPLVETARTDAPLTSPTYRIQIIASQDPLSTDDSRLAQWTGGEYIRNGLYKYAVGSFDSSVEASLQKSQIQNQGFPDAFVVKFEGKTWEEQGSNRSPKIDSRDRSFQRIQDRSIGHRRADLVGARRQLPQRVQSILSVQYLLRPLRENRWTRGIQPRSSERLQSGTSHSSAICRGRRRLTRGGL